MKEKQEFEALRKAMVKALIQGLKKQIGPAMEIGSAFYQPIREVPHASQTTNTGTFYTVVHPQPEKAGFEGIPTPEGRLIRTGATAVYGKGILKGGEKAFQKELEALKRTLKARVRKALQKKQ